MHRWNEEEHQFLRDNAKGISPKELTQRFNEKFGTNVTKDAVKSQLYRTLHIQTGYNAHFFNKGRTAHNKGVPMTKEQYEKAKATMFKKGNIPNNKYNIGKEVIKNGEYYYKKTGEGIWESKARYIYKQYHGQIEDNKQIIFADGDTTNFNIDNLIAVTKAEMLIMNQKGLYKKNKELTIAGVNVAKLIHKIYKR